jgi:uncharacterized protein
MRAVALLQRHGIDFHVVTVLTEPALDDPDRLFDFFVNHAIREVGFNVEEIEGANRRSSLEAAGVEARFRTFIRGFLRRVWEQPGSLKLRELETGLGILLSDEPIKDQQNVPFAIVSVGHDGTLSTFSPELLDAGHPRFGGFAFGQVGADPLAAIAASPLFAAVNDEIRQGVAACERTCSYFRWCGGGAPANKLFETGRFDATETMHCRLTRKAMLDAVIELTEPAA